MEKEASLLRCSKLSCYGEFNKMVQAISRNRAVRDIPGIAPMQGTSAEYHFYATLVLMLKGVVNNADPISQKQELQQVYKWFCLNKPLIKSKTKPTHSKPKVSLAKRGNRDKQFLLNTELDRPQTAPAMLNHPQSFIASSASWKRPHTYGNHGNGIQQRKKTPTFTSSYISRSLSKDLDLIGQPLDQLQLNNAHQNSSRHSAHSQSVSTPSTTPEHNKPAKKSSPPVIAFPSPEFLVGYNPLSGRDFSDQRPATVGAIPMTIGTVFSMAPNVAAQMTLSRELNQHKQMMMQRRVQSPQPLVQNRQLLNTPNELERVPPQASVPVPRDIEIKREEVTGSPANLDTFERNEEQMTAGMRSRVGTPDQGESETQTITNDRNERTLSSRLQQVRTPLLPSDRKTKKRSLYFHHSQSGAHYPDIGQLNIKGHTLCLGESGKQDSSSISVVHSETSHHMAVKDEMSAPDSNEEEEDQDTRHPVSSASVCSQDSPPKLEDQEKLEKHVDEPQGSKLEESKQENTPLDEPQLQVEDVLLPEPNNEYLSDDDVLTLQAEDVEEIPTIESSTNVQADTQAIEDNDHHSDSHDLSQTPQLTESTISSKQFQTVSTESVPVSPVPTVTIKSPSSPAQNIQRPHSAASIHQRSLPMNVVSISFQPKNISQTHLAASSLGAMLGGAGTTFSRKKTPNIHGAGFNRRRYQRRRTVNVPVT